MTVTADIDTQRYGTPDQAPEPAGPLIAASTHVYAGTIALINNAGYCKASDSPLSTDSCIGIVSKQVDNTSGSFLGGALGAGSVPVDRGTFWISFDNGGGAFTQADATFNSVCYVKDAQTVTKTNTTCVAGVIKAFDSTLSKVAVALGTNAGTIF